MEQTKTEWLNTLLSEVRDGGRSDVLDGISTDSNIDTEVLESVIIQFLENEVIRQENDSDIDDSFKSWGKLDDDYEQRELIERNKHLY